MVEGYLPRARGTGVPARQPDEEFPLHSDAFWAAAGRPEFRSVAARLFDKGLQERDALEYDLGEDIAAVAQSA